jgi:hypothetical protein
LTDQTVRHAPFFAFERMLAKSKIICIDACKSGDLEDFQPASFNIDNAVEDFAGNGYAVFASSSAIQNSWPHPNKPVSLFTSFLCEAIKDKLIICKEQKSLFDIKKLLFLYLDTWNKNNPDIQQTPIFKANMGGTIFFKIGEYQPFCTGVNYEETEAYIIYAVEPLHNRNAKRFAVKVILKCPFSFEEIARINHEIVKKVKYVDIYQNAKFQQLWQGQSASLVFCYYGRDETDVINSNYLCHTTWADNTQDKMNWYKLNTNDKLIDDIHFNIHSYYSTLKTFTVKNTPDKDALIAETKAIRSNLITSAEKVIRFYNEFKNHTMSEDVLITNLAPILENIERDYNLEIPLSMPPIELYKWSQAHSSLAGTVHDFTLFYNARYISCRTHNNRIACMDMTIERYYKDLETITAIEKELSNIN